MKIYSNATDAISELHLQGFTNDFHLSGNDLLWVQEGHLIRAGEFAIIKYYKIVDPRKKTNGLMVFGIIALYHNIKGILLNRFKNNSNGIPPVLIRKINETIDSRKNLSTQNLRHVNFKDTCEFK